jgi:hypothetical protein
VGGRVVGVQARLPVGDDVRRLHLPDRVGHPAHLFPGVPELAVLPGAEEHLGSERLRGRQGLALLLLGVGRRARLRVAALAEREVQDHDAVAEPLVTGEQGAGRDLGIPGVGPDRQHGTIGRRRESGAGDEGDQGDHGTQGVPMGHRPPF